MNNWQKLSAIAIVSLIAFSLYWTKVVKPFREAARKAESICSTVDDLYEKTEELNFNDEKAHQIFIAMRNCRELLIIFDEY